MTFHEILASLGIDPAVLYAGGFGGVLRALSHKRFKFREMVAAPVCGALAAAYLTMPVVYYVRTVGIPMTEDPLQAILAAAFLIGTCAMWIADWVFDAMVRWIKPKEAD